MRHPNPRGDAMIDKNFPCLNHGFVRLIDYLGSDSRVVQSARVSYGDGTKSVREDKGLIDYLLRHQHTSPFEQASVTFHMKMPIFVARQIVRHRTAKLNEISGRYSVMKDEFYIPALEDVNFQSKDNKQGRSTEEVDPTIIEKLLADLESEQIQDYEAYEGRIEQGIAKELARVNLPLSLYTEWYWTIDLHNLMHFLALRLDSHAQKEVRVYAQAIYEIVKEVYPFTMESFDEHILHGIRLSRTELKIVFAALQEGGFLSGELDALKVVAEEKGLIYNNDKNEPVLSKFKEFIDKLNRVQL